MNERRTKLEAIFHAAMDLDSAAERECYLDKACGEDPELRHEVQELLRSAAAAEPVFQAGLEAFQVTETTPEVSLAEKPGDWIGRYKLLEKIGEGGMGVVYLAEQREPVVRRVALKIIKLGMDTRQVVARFEAERQALALMDHPHIAQVLDGGATETGRPYFVMELVQGVPITEFCETNDLSLEARLKLFMVVCQAIQSAHQKGIIHRDIKPSNVLVTLHNEVSHPMVIDFGVAKATGQKLTEKTLFTNFATMIGTPAYMSPEQAEMSKLDVDTRSDIYSLGVLLYELLTGTTPFSEERLRSVAYSEMQRIIAEEEPERPSTRLRRKSAGSATPLVSRPSSLATDLDWIVMKCLEKDRNRRYETANGLATDLNRHLTNEPVMARPPSHLYEFQKTVRRHKVGFVGTGAVILALAIGVGVSIWQARNSALEAAKATAISEFLQEMLKSANPDSAKGSDYTVRQLMDDLSAGLQHQFENQPEVEATVRTTIGMAYYRLGDGAKAQQHLERALSLRRRLYGEGHELVADTLVAYAWSLYEQSQWGEAEKQARRALEIYSRNQSSPKQVIETLWVLQQTLAMHDQREESARVARQALALADRNPNQKFAAIASMLHALAEDREWRAEYQEAEALALQAIAMHRSLRGEGHVEQAWAMLCLGRAQKGLNKLTEAESTLREALAIFRRDHPDGHKSIEGALGSLREVLAAQRDVAGIEALTRQELTRLTKRLKQNRGDAEFWRRSALLHRNLKMWAESEQHLERAIDLSEQATPTEKLAFATEACHLSEEALPTGQVQLAERAVLLSMGLSTQLVQDDRSRPEHQEILGRSQRQLGFVLTAAGQHNRARQAQKDGLDIAEQGIRDFPDHAVFLDSRAHSQLALGQALMQLGSFEPAAQHLHRAVEYFSEATSNSQEVKYPQAASDSLQALGRSLEWLGRLEAAMAEYHKGCGVQNKGLAADMRLRLASLMLDLGRLDEAEDFIGQVPLDDAEAVNNLAWYFATWARPADRDGAAAMKLASKAVAMANRTNYVFLDTLAAAQARCGNFPEAIRIQEEAASLVANQEEKKGYLFRVNLYREKEAYADHLFLLGRACGLRAAGKFSRAEELARESIKVLEKELPASWQLFEAQSTLGGVLLGQARYSDAEPFLLSSYEGLRQHTNLFPEVHQRLSKDVLQSLVRMYDATGQASNLAQWKQKLAELDTQMRASAP